MDEELQELLAQVKFVALTMTYTDDLSADAALGELEAAVYSARQHISDVWRAARAQRPHKTPNAPTLDDLA
jgi:hypothetical protein